MEMRLGFLGKPEHERVPQPPTGGGGGGAVGIPPGAAASASQQQQQQQQLSGHGSHRSGSATPSQSSGYPDPMMQQQPQPHMSSPFGGATHQGSPSKPSGSGGQFSWQGGEMGMTLKDGTHVPIDTVGAGSGAAGKDEAVEMMSTDSSSSSSTDSN